MYQAWSGPYERLPPIWQQIGRPSSAAAQRHAQRLLRLCDSVHHTLQLWCDVLERLTTFAMWQKPSVRP
jgi:hypothetical protein